jgi:hypothetical protein
MGIATVTTGQRTRRTRTSLAIKHHPSGATREACVSGFSSSQDSTVPPSQPAGGTVYQCDRPAFAPPTAIALRSVFARPRARARTSATAAPYTSMLHCYKRHSPCSSHSSLTTSHCLFNRQPRRLEFTVTHTKETPATQINRQLSGPSRNTNHNLPITNKTPSNRQWQILEFNVTHTKQTTAPRSNQHFLRFVNLQIPHSREFHRARAAFEGPPSTLDVQPSRSVSNRNNVSFKIAGNSLKIRAERNPNRNTKRESRPAFHKSPITASDRAQTPARTALTAQHASPTMKMQARKRAVANVVRPARNTNRGTLITTH